MSEKTPKFICPLPWMSLSIGPNSRPRVCCHQNGALKHEPAKSIEALAQLEHNDEIKNKFLKGEIPSECGECHSLEKSGCSSPRLQYLELFKGSFNTASSALTYLDISIDNTCNLECAMCSPHFSHRLNSFFTKELKTADVARWALHFSNEELRPLLAGLQMLTLRGGETLISPKALGLLRFIATSGEASHIDLRIFTNLTILPEDLETILNSFRQVHFIMSIDSVNENYEFIRYPARWGRLQDNIRLLKTLSLPRVQMDVHVMVMALNWSYLPELLSYVREQKLIAGKCLPVLAELENPSYLHVRSLPEDEFKSGLRRLRSYILELDSQPAQKAEKDNALNLLQKIEDQNERQTQMEYQVYLQKLKRYRESHVSP